MIFTPKRSDHSSAVEETVLLISAPSTCVCGDRVRRLVLAPVFALLFLSVYAGCISMSPRMIEETYRPGLDPAVAAALNAMTAEDAVELLSRYIQQHVAKNSPHTPAAAPMLGAFAREMSKPSVTTNGYSYGTTSSSRAGDKLNVTIARIDMPFTKVASAVVVKRFYGRTERIAAIRLYDHKGALYLECPIDGSEMLVPRVLAAVELLCPNIRMSGLEETP